MTFLGVSSWCNGYSDVLRNCNKRVRTPVAYYIYFRTNTLVESYEPLIFLAMSEIVPLFI